MNLRRIVLPCIALVLAFGCLKKAPPGGQGDTVPSGPDTVTRPAVDAASVSTDATSLLDDLDAEMF